MAILAKGQITLTTVSNGSDVYISINGGVRGIAYAADGTNPNPVSSTPFTATTLKNNREVKPISYKWTCGGNLTGTSTSATFTPQISKTYQSGSSYVSVEIIMESGASPSTQTIPIVSTKNADGLDWLADWNNGKTTIKDKSIASPRIFAGTNESNNPNSPILTGVALGKDVLTGSNAQVGIVGYQKNAPIFKLGTDATFLLSTNGDAGSVEKGAATGLYFDGKKLSITGKVSIKSGSIGGSDIADVVSGLNNGAEAKNKVDNLQIGTRNLARKDCFSKYSSSSTSTTIDNSSFISDGGVIFSRTAVSNEGPTIDRYTVYESGKEYVISFKIKANVGSIANFQIYNGCRHTQTSVYVDGVKKGSFDQDIPLPPDKNYHNIELYFIASSVDRGDASAVNTTHTILQPLKTSATAYTAQVLGFKIEKGNKPTEWTPAPEDVQGGIDGAQVSADNALNEIGQVGNVASSALNKINDITVAIQGNTYIKGDLITNGTITGNMIKAGSFAIRNETMDRDTFSINENGDVSLNGTLKSDFFDPLKNIGYKISPDGVAILNEARISGEFVMPNAGLTNYGATLGNQNLLKSSGSFVGSTGNWVSNSSSVALDKNTTFNDYATVKSVGNGGMVYNGYIELKKNTQYIYSVMAKAKVKINGGNSTPLHMWLSDKQDASHLEMVIDGSKTSIGTEFSQSWVVFKTPNVAAKYYMRPFIYGVGEGNEVWLASAKIEETRDNRPTPWCPHKDEQFNYTRIWAGSTYGTRDTAPFRVNQNGDVWATNATLSGRLLGDYDNGNVHISNNQIYIDSTKTWMDNETREIRSLTPLDASPNSHVILGEGQSVLNTDVVFGSNSDKRIEYSNLNRLLNLHNTSLKYSNGTTDIALDGYSWRGFRIGDNGGTNLGFGYTTGTWKGTSIVSHTGARGGTYKDINIRRENYNEDIEVQVEGSLTVRTSVKGRDNKIEQRMASDGWGWYSI